MGRLAWITCVLLLLSGLAGCLSDDTDTGQPVTETSTTTSEDVSGSLDLSAEGCTMAGGHSVHPRDVAGAWQLSDQVPDPWQVADVVADVGPQLVYSEIPDPAHPVPEEGETWGHYHATISCDAWTLDGEPLEDVILGFVGPKVKAPSFAPSAADNTYLATVLATNNQAIYETLQAAGFDMMWAEGSISQVADESVEVFMRTDHNGEYLSIFDKKELGDNHVPHLRLWSQPENVNGTYTPIALDLQTTGGTHYGAEGQGYFHHARTGHHYPLPGAYGHTAAFMLEGFDVGFEVGPQLDVVLEEAYDH